MLSAPQRTYFNNKGGGGTLSNRKGKAGEMKPRQASWWPMFLVSSLVATTMLTILTATAAEAKKCKTLRLPSGERFASCGRAPRVINPHADIYVGRGWVIGGDRYSQRKGSGY